MAGFGMPEFLINLYAEMYQAMQDGRMSCSEPRTPHTTTPTSLAAFVRETLAPAIQGAAKQ